MPVDVAVSNETSGYQTNQSISSWLAAVHQRQIVRRNSMRRSRSSRRWKSCKPIEPMWLSSQLLLKNYDSDLEIADCDGVSPGMDRFMCTCFSRSLSTLGTHLRVLSAEADTRSIQEQFRCSSRLLSSSCWQPTTKALFQTSREPLRSAN